jgi:hypothetical protein
MSLFLLLGIPLVCVFVSMLTWDSESVPRRLSLVSLFFTGVLLFLPAYIVMLILRRIVGFAFTGFALYACLMARDHLAPALLAVGAFLLVQRRFALQGSREGIFLTVFVFLSGFFTLFGPADFLALYGHWTPESLFLRPLQRLSLILVVSMAAPATFRWQGRSAAAFLSVAGVWSLALALLSWLSNINRGWIAVLGTAAAFLAAAVVFARDYTRALRIR